MRREMKLRREPVVDGHDGEARLQQAGEQRRRERFLAARAEAAAVDIDHQRRRRGGRRLPQIEHIALVRAVFFVGEVGCGQARALGLFLGSGGAGAKQDEGQQQADGAQALAVLGAHRGLHIVGDLGFQ